MICPVCRQMMVVLEFEKLEVDYCPSCGGIWLDSGELELLFGDLPGGSRYSESLVIQQNVKEKIRSCPKCNSKMEKVLSGNNVLIDRCKKDHGLWFDKNELQTLVQFEYSEKNARVPYLLKKIFGQNKSEAK
jgi:Zn-finger nucleic acid-binding protein